MTLFEGGYFRLHSGRISSWKIDCDALCDSELDVLASLAAKIISPFTLVVPVLYGGERFAKALRQYSTGKEGEWPTLIVDDVMTTGASMKAAQAIWVETGLEVKGIVIFSRGKVLNWVTTLFQVHAALEN